MTTPLTDIFPDASMTASVNVAKAHQFVAKWLRQQKRRRDHGSDRSAQAALAALASELRLPPPLLYDLAHELRAAGPLPALHCGYRAFPLRPATETVILQVPLLEPVDPKPDQPVTLRAFRGWLVVEKVTVPTWDDGSPLWTGGHVYGAPAFELLDQDIPWRDALKAAETWLRAQAPSTWPGDFDLRWSLARTDGGVLPPILLGNHLAAAFALAFGQAAGIALCAGLNLRGSVVLGAMDNQGRLTNPSVDADPLQLALEAAARAGSLALLLSALGLAWPENWGGEGWSIHVEPCETLLTAVKALRPASDVVAAEHRAAGDIEFLTGQRPIASHYQDVPLLCEVPRARLRERQLGAPSDQDAERPAASTLPDHSRERATAVMIYDYEEHLHDNAGSLDRTPVHWRELFANFAKHCPDASSAVPHFIVIGVPGSGKSIFLQYLAWLAGRGDVLPAKADAGRHSADGASFDYGHRFAVRISLREWEEYASHPNHSKHLEDFLASEHPAARRSDCLSAQDWHKQWQQWLNSHRLILLLDGLDEVRPEFARRIMNDLDDWRRRFPIVLTCRTLSIDAYRGVLAKWPVFVPAKFTAEQIHSFIEDYPRLKGRLQTDALERQLEAHPQMQPLAEVPMLLNVICYVVDDGLQLPATRTELYSVAVNRLLQRDHEPALTKYRSNDPEHVATARRVLAAIAAALFRENEGLKPLNPERFAQVLDDQHPRTTAPDQWGQCREDLKNWFLRRSGLLRESRAGYTFLHNQFLEFLAGEGLAADPSFGAHVAAAIRNVDAWREVIKYAASRKLVQGTTDEERQRARLEVRALIEALAGGAWLSEPQQAPSVSLVADHQRAPPFTDPTSDLGWRKFVLAGEIIMDLCTGSLKPEHLAGEAVLSRLRERLVTLIGRESLPHNRPPGREDRKGLTNIERARAGTVLGRLGDPRPGVGLRPDGLPDIVFVPEPPEQPLPPGKFVLAENRQKVTIPQPYRISRYPTTAAQFAAFVQAGGYAQEKYWAEARTDGVWDDGKVRVFKSVWRDCPADLEEQFQLANHPIVKVTWYEAVAFCRWLNERLGLKPGSLRLPNEAEWEQAARWNLQTRQADRRLYPSGGPQAGEDEREHLSRHCNWSDTGIGHTSAVGLFPAGQAGCGALDMAGNVMEWCDNKRNPSAEPRVLRGGSWLDYAPVRLRAADRNDRPPAAREVDCGFRVVGVVGRTTKNSLIPDVAILFDI